MKLIIKKLLSGIKELLISIISIIQVIRRSSFNRIDYSWIDNINEDCLVVGSGPSLTDILKKNKDIFKKMSKLCVNDIVLSDLYQELKPEYYVLVDPAYFSISASRQLIINRDQVIHELIKKTTWKMILFLPSQTKKLGFFDEVSKKNSNIRIIYFNSTPVEGFRSFRHFLYKLGLGMPQVQNVLIAGIFFMLNAGYKKIYLIGADHSWHETIALDFEGRVCVRDVHAYDLEETSYTPFYKDVEETETFKMSEIFEALATTFRGYYYLEEYSRRLGVRVFNASTKTYIDAFERIII